MKFHSLVIIALAVAAPVQAQVFLSQDKALALAFSGDAVRHTLFLSDDDKKRVRDAAQAPVDMSVVTYYTGTLTDGTTGWAFFETNIVRTMPETFMTVIDGSGAVRFVELLSFYEPGDYLPPKRWVEQFRGRRTNEELTLKRGLRNITGATLTAQSMSDGVRRAVALRHFALEKK